MFSATTLLFPPFRLDTANQQLWRESQLLRLRPKTYKVLLYFARNSQRLVTKEELLNNVWDGVSVSGELLRVYIRELRQILGDEPNAPRYIETVTARGYRFLPPVASGPFSQPGEDGPREADPTLKDGSAADLRTTSPSPSLRRSVPIPVGILHSLTGYMALSESPVIDATLLASSEKPIGPETFPGSRTSGEWRAFLEDLFKRWQRALDQTDPLRAVCTSRI